MTSYGDFLSAKTQYSGDDGVDIDPESLHPQMLDFQRALTAWALRKGRSAIFADCGTGKTLMQLVWSENVRRITGRPVLIVTPLAVSYQTVLEAAKFGIEAAVSRTGAVAAGITVTNYDRLHLFRADDYAGVVCDESSAIKAYDGQRRALVTEFLRTMRWRLLCTATAAPNDYLELGTSSEALGYLGHTDMLGRFFTNSQQNVSQRRGYGGAANEWRFKGHAEVPFWRWVASWARALRKPSDLGFEDGGFVLPPLEHRQHIVRASQVRPGRLFDLPAVGLHEEREELRRTLTERCETVVRLVRESWEQQVVPSTGGDITPPTERNASGISATPTNGIVRNVLPQESRGENAGLRRSSESTSDSTTSGIERGTGRGMLSGNLDAMGLQRAPSLRSSNDRAGAAESAGASRPRSGVSTLITTIAPVPFEVSYATLATYGSGVSSRVTSGDCRSVARRLPNTSLEPWVLWVHLNAEQEFLEKAFGDLAFSVSGSLDADEKERRLLGFINRERPILITKPSVAGWGLNLQHCHRMTYFPSHSFEQYYQSVRRCWRFGQRSPVVVDVVTTPGGEHALRNLERKEEQASRMFDALVAHMRDAQGVARSRTFERSVEVPSWLAAS